MNFMDKFFQLGDKATGGDPLRKASFDYYLLWIIFFAFGSIGVGNFYQFWQTSQIAYLGWTVVMIGILWFQYYGLKQVRVGLIAMKEFKSSMSTPNPPKEADLEDESKMIGGFK